MPHVKKNLENLKQKKKNQKRFALWTLVPVRREIWKGSKVCREPENSRTTGLNSKNQGRNYHRCSKCTASGPQNKRVPQCYVLL